jgi:hypothetical protein
VVLAQSGQLALPSDFHPLGDLDGGFPRAASKVGETDGWNLHMEVDTVQEWPRDTMAITLDQGRRTAALVSGVTQMTAGAWIHGRQEGEAGRESMSRPSPDDGDLPVFQRLSQGLQGIAAKFGQLVQEEHPGVGKTDLSWARYGTASYHASGADAGVGAAKGSLNQETLQGLVGGKGLDFGGSNGFCQRERRQDTRKPPGKHGLPRSRWTEEEEVVSPCGGDLQGSSCSFLSPDLGEIGSGG